MTAHDTPAWSAALTASASRVLDYLGIRNLRGIGWILVVGLAVRFALLPLSAHPWDVYVWYQTGDRVYSGGPLYTSAPYGYAYPPVWGGFITVMDGIYRLVAPIVGAHPISAAAANAAFGTTGNLGAPIVVDWLFATLIKLPLVVFDLLTTLLLCDVVRRRLGRPEWVAPVAAAFFLNPFVILISSVWGQFDIVATYLVLLGALLLIDHHPWLAGVAFGLSVATKYFPALLIVALLIVYASARQTREYVTAAVVTIAMLALVSVPFLIATPAAYIGAVTSPDRGVPSAESQTLWSFLESALRPGWSAPDWLTLALLAAIAAVVVTIALYLRRIRAAAPDEPVWIDAIIIACLAFYLLYRTVNVQYFIWVFPALTLESVRRRLPLSVLAGLSVLLVADAVFGINGTSFFLPSLTISMGFSRVFPPLHLPAVAPELGLVTWLAVVGLFAYRMVVLRRGTGQVPPENEGAQSPSSVPSHG